MTALANRSIDWMRILKKESNNAFDMIETGYVSLLICRRCLDLNKCIRYMFLSSRKEKMLDYAMMSEAASLNGTGLIFRGFSFFYILNLVFCVGATRYHDSKTAFDYDAHANFIDGIDLIENKDAIRKLIPGVTEDAKCMMHVRKAGYLNVEKLGW